VYNIDTLLNNIVKKIIFQHLKTKSRLITGKTNFVPTLCAPDAGKYVFTTCLGGMK